jgi:tRNA(Met) cytidine acetyltransferase
MTELNNFIQRLRVIGKNNGHRYLVFLSGPQAWGQGLLAACDIQAQSTLLLAANPILGLSPRLAKKCLGQEFATVLIDAYSAQAVDDWLAAAGTLVAGGVLLVLCPELEAWPVYFQAHSDAASDNVESFFLKRFLKTMYNATGVYHIDHRQNIDVQLSAKLPVVNSLPWIPVLPSIEQEKTVDALERVAKGRAKRPLVIRSDRGRGKTSALGIAAARLMREGVCKRIAISAVTIHSVDAAFRQVHKMLPSGEAFDSGFRFKDCEFIFVPPFELNADGDWDLILVDEAASIAVSLLQEFLTHPRVVFSTTVHGYEGSGRGFDIRFKEILNRERPQWRRIELREPLRWAADDPLEACLEEAFLLSAEPSLPDDGVDHQIRVLQKDDLMQDDVLAQVFGLLVQAHYQTSPRDLQYMLDSSSVIIVAECGQCIVGVCQLIPEGGLSAELTAAIIAGQRRPKGHLVTQRLAHITADVRYGQSTSYRVNRIAVVSESRRKGIGRGLLQVAEQFAKDNCCAYLSSSFAASSDVIPFWLQNGFKALWLGSKRDASSGAYSLIVAKAIFREIDLNFKTMQQELLQDVSLTIRHVHKRMSADILVALSAAKSDYGPAWEADFIVTQRYCGGELFFEQAAASLTRMCNGLNLLGYADAELAICALILGEDWGRLSERYQLNGRFAVENRLRNLFQEIIENYI